MPYGGITLRSNVPGGGGGGGGIYSEGLFPR